MCVSSSDIVYQAVNLQSPIDDGLLYVCESVDAMDLGDYVQLHQSVASLLGIGDFDEFLLVPGTYVTDVSEPVVNESELWKRHDC